MTTYQPGEVVNVTIKGARIDSAGDNYIGFLLGGIQHGVHASAPEVTVERVAPAEWPPQPGDLWRDREGGIWFASDMSDGDELESRIRMVGSTIYEHGDFRTPSSLNQDYGPLTLVHREGGEQA